MRYLLLIFAAPLLAGCPNTDAAIFVDPSLDAPAVAVTSSALGVGVGGSFMLKLHLGARASGPSQVNVGQFAIKDAKGDADILTPLALAPKDSSVMFPVTVQQDSDVSVELAFDTGSKLEPTDVGAKLCDAAGITIGGTIEDSLQDTATPVDSEVFHAAGCM